MKCMLFLTLVVHYDVVKAYDHTLVDDGLKYMFTTLIKVLGALVKPKGITSHLHCPILALKVICHRSVFDSASF